MEFPKTDNEVVCIIGSGYAWDECVFGDPNKDYWTMNNMYGAKDKIDPQAFDEWFQIHRPGCGLGHVDDQAMRAFLGWWKKPCWVQKDWGDDLIVVNPWIYPIDEVLAKYCPADVNGVIYPYFTNSIDYMLCLAMLRNYKEIHLHGVEFISQNDDEYYQMRQSVNYYMGQAKAIGIKVIVQPHSSLLRGAYWYGYGNKRRDSLEKLMSNEMEEITKRRTECESKMFALQQELSTLDGGIQTLKQSLDIAKLRDRGAQI